MTQKTLPCIVCDKQLNNVSGVPIEKDNQPSGGLEFVAYGHYGSSEHDPMDGSKLILNLCDHCVRWCRYENKIKFIPNDGTSYKDSSDESD